MSENKKIGSCINLTQVFFLIHQIHSKNLKGILMSMFHKATGGVDIVLVIS